MGMPVTAHRWYPLPRLAGVARMWGGHGRFRLVATGPRWALVLIRRDDTVDVAGRKAGH